MATSSASGRAAQQSGKGTPTNLQLLAGPSQLIQDLLDKKFSKLEVVIRRSLKNDILGYLCARMLITYTTESMPHDDPSLPEKVVTEIILSLKKYPNRFEEFILALERFDLNLAIEIQEEYEENTRAPKEIGQKERASKRVGLSGSNGATPASKRPRFSDDKTEESNTGEEEVDTDEAFGEPVYPMRSNPHGQAVIINQLETQYPITSKHAVSKFRNTFEYLGYKVQDYPPQSEEDLLALMKPSKLKIRRGDDSFICCIMAHGSDGEIVAKNGTKVSLQLLHEAVDLKHCETLRGCPKIFIIYACRGSEPMKPLDSGIEAKEEFALGIKLSHMADFYTAYSTPKGFITPIDPSNNACPYLDNLCSVFRSKAGRLSLDEMVMEVHHNLEESVCDVDGKGEHIQMGQVTHTLRGPVYFKKT